MSTVIKNGTIVTADRTYKSDVLIENGKIVSIGTNLSGSDELDATGCYVMPGGIDPHTHLEMPFMGTYSSDNFESGTPESFNVMVKELRSLGLNLDFKENLKDNNITNLIGSDE